MLLDCMRCGLIEARTDAYSQPRCPHCGRQVSTTPHGEHIDLDARAEFADDYEDE